MNLFNKIFMKKNISNAEFSSRYSIVEDDDTFIDYNTKVMQNDIVKSAKKPILKQVGKLNVSHIIENDKFEIESDEDLNMLLKEPNSMMSMQILLEKFVGKALIKGNSFLYIDRNKDNLRKINGIYPLDIHFAELKEVDGELIMKCHFDNGKINNIPYGDILHFRAGELLEGKFFADNPELALKMVLDVVSITDQGIIKQIKNSSIFKWIMKFNQILKDEKLEEKSSSFNKRFMGMDSNTNGGAIATDPSYDLVQVRNENNFIPEAGYMEIARTRIYSYFGTNEKIVTNIYTEDEFNAFYESVIEPIAKQLSDEFTRKIFTRLERLRGNKIIFDSTNLTFTSVDTKLKMVAMVDRQALTPNEWRKIMNMPTYPGGDDMLRRLDTKLAKDSVDTLKGGEEDENGSKKSDDTNLES